MKKRLFTTLIATVLAAGVLTGCGNQETAQTTGTDDVEIETGDNVEVDLDEEEETEEGTEEGSEEAAVEIKGTITVAASATPHAEILEQAKSFLAEKGWDLEVTVFDDYIQPNLVVESGEFDANYFQHIPYLDSFNEEQGTHLVNVGGIHYEPFGIYPGTESDLANISEGAVIAVPNDPTNEARALLLLQDNGIITLKEGAGLTATINDIESNPNNIEIKELEAAQVARVKDEVAFVVLNGNYALEAGFSVGSDAVAYELSDSEAAKTYVNVVAVKEGNEENEGIKALVEVLKSDDIKSFIADTYDGAVVAFD
ncbi:MAG: ABC transporter substrate-binding protein [Lachnospiraceae bacterium]|nr:ABC transporter substrate-binding protein [Lachnospiraceae bacterium]